MEHAVAGNGVILGITTHRGCDRTADSGLLVQDIIELERDGERIATEEALRYLGVPDELVGVHRVVGITTATLHVEVGGERRAPRSGDAYHTTIGELPGVEVVVGLELAAVVVIVQRTVELDLEPVVTVAGSQTLANTKRSGD